MYVWKAKNNKLFRRINKDPLKTVHYAKSQCHAWFEANSKHEESEVTQNSQQITISDRYMIDVDHGNMMHSSVVMDEHEQILQE